MTEAEEVAKVMLVAYNQWNATLPEMHRGYSSTKVRNYVNRMLRETESYTVIDAVYEALDQLVRDQRHDWFKGELPLFKQGSSLIGKWMCKKCGILRNDNNYQGICRGKVKVTLR